MTQLDAGVIALLVLIGLGGYRQGLIRGLTRVAGLIGIGVLSVALSGGSLGNESAQNVLVRTLALFGGVVLVVGALTWIVNQAVPRAWHDSTINRILGVIPAVVQGLIVLALLLGLYHRVALTQETQHYLARGILTGPLIQPFAWLEQTLAGLR